MDAGVEFMKRGGTSSIGTFTDVTALRLLANRQQHRQRGHRRLAFTHPDTLDTVSA
jgi:hypothetical protein